MTKCHSTSLIVGFILIVFLSLVGCGGSSETGSIPQIQEMGVASFWVGLNKPLAGATVTVKDTNNQWLFDVVTNEFGHGVMDNITPGIVYVTAIANDGRADSSGGQLAFNIVEGMNNQFEITFDGWNTAKTTSIKKNVCVASATTCVDFLATDHVPEMANIYVTDANTGKEVYSGVTSPAGRIDDVAIPVGEYKVRAVNSAGKTIEYEYKIYAGDNVLTFAF